MTSPLPGPQLSVAAVATLFRRVLEGGEGRADDQGGADARIDALVALHRTNVEQWALEDTTRAPQSSDTVVARAKREIDALNLRRHGWVEAADAAIAAACAPPSNAPLATESPAMAFDRLSVLVIRIHHTEAAAGSGGEPAASYAARLPVLYGQLEALTAALQGLLDEARDGVRSYLPYEQLKLYGRRAGDSPRG
jgi:hypothetical protein